MNHSEAIPYWEKLKKFYFNVDGGRSKNNSLIYTWGYIAALKVPKRRHPLPNAMPKEKELFWYMGNADARGDYEID